MPTKYKKREREEGFMRWIKSLPCTVESVDCRGRIEAAHVGERGLSRKCSDFETIPLCSYHHRMKGPGTQYWEGKNFWPYHGLDKAELIAGLRRCYALLTGETDEP